MPKTLQPGVLSIESLWDHMIFTEARVRYDDNAKDLADDIAKFCNKILGVRLGQLNYWKDETFAQAGVFANNFYLDDFTPKLERAVRRALEDAGVKDPTQDPHYKAYFREPSSRIIGKALRGQLEVTRPMLAHLRTEKNATVQVLLPTLETLVTTSTKALEDQQQAEALRRNHRNDEIIPLFDEANKLRKTLFGTLTLREAERDLPTGWAESFFRKQASTEDDPAELKQDAVLLLCRAQGITLSKENKKKITEQFDVSILDRWIVKVTTIKEEAELFV